MIMENVFVHESSYVDEGCQIGKGTKIWHFSHIMKGCIIGEDCNIGQNVVISPDVVLGRNCKIQNNVSVYTGVRCEDDVFLGPSMVFTNVINPRAAVSRKDEYRETIIKRGASVGANATRPLIDASALFVAKASLVKGDGCNDNHDDKNKTSYCGDKRCVNGVDFTEALKSGMSVSEMAFGWQGREYGKFRRFWITYNAKTDTVKVSKTR